MKKALLLILLSLGYFAQAQSPRLTVKDSDSAQVKMSQLLVNVKIVGNIAYTTAEMHFFNKGTRQMEAELLFPLPEGVSVSRYAIDINGKMREAVPVNKNKGKQVFEAIEHRRVDPGLLEKVEGNNFKTRIYPILPNSERIVVIGYEQELPNFDQNNLAFQLVSTYNQKLQKFEVVITVLGATSKPSVISDTNEATLLDNLGEATWNQSYQTNVKKTNYQPSEKILIKIPIQKEIPSVVVQSVNDQHYFYANTAIEGHKIMKKSPNSIGLIWDVSLSCKNRDLKKELMLLDTYFKQLKNTEVTLYLLSYNFEKKQSFTITNGEWTALKTQLENTIYDGGTRFSQIKLPTHDEYLFFTDGLSSLSSNQLDKTNNPIYTISSSVSSDYAFLNYNSLKTGGSFINLNQLNTTQALDKMLYSGFKFLGIKENSLVTEIYPTIGTPVSGSFSVSGISLKPKNEIVLLFGYDGKATIEKKIVLDAENKSTNEVNIEKLWAQKKIANLELQYKQNAEEIEMMGQKHGIITQNTSLIVLENIDDYIAYDIVPPAELRAEFDSIAKQQRERLLARQVSNWDNVENYRYQLQSWWNKNLKYTAGKKSAKVKKEGAVTINADEEVELVAESVGNAQSDAMEEPAPPPVDQVKFVQPVVAKAEEVTDAGFEEINDQKLGEKGTQQLESVVVTAMGIRRTPGRVNVPNPTNNRDGDLAENIKVTSWNPDRLYLKVLAAASADKKYQVYLELRETQENNPNFYFDVANYFYNSGNKQKGLLVLSNIADWV